MVTSEMIKKLDPSLNKISKISSSHLTLNASFCQLNCCSTENALYEEALEKYNSMVESFPW